MSTSRRDFLKKGSVIALAAGVPISAAESVLGAERSTASPGLDLSKEHFASQLNRAFFINQGKQQILTKLIDVSDLAKPRGFIARRGKEGFTLTFEGQRGLTQNTYTIENAKLGKFSMFLVPVGSQNQETVRYEAVINRLYP
jgi:Domain of unknown function (DUF6916)